MSTRYEVRRDGERVGTITRTKGGSVFAYDDGVVPREGEEGIATTLPYARRRFETVGVNLHPFFAGLLPEGLRLRALVRRLKTSEDDLLGLLAAAGADCVGDVSIVPHGASHAPATPALDARKAGEVRFAELLEKSLAAGPRAREPTIPGVQEKIGAAMISFPVRGRARGAAYILKLNPPHAPRLVENEAFFLRMGSACGLDVARAELVRDRDGEPGLLVERFDRSFDAEAGRLRALHQEDACQLLERYPADKYQVDCREVGEAIARVVTAPAVEMLRYLRLWAFSYLVANGDLHAKNVSVLRVGDRVTLTPAYDLLSTLPYGDRRMATKLRGRDDDVRRADFVAMGEQLGVRPRATEEMLDALADQAAPWLGRVEEIDLGARKSADLERVMRKRRDDLGASRARAPRRRAAR